MLGVEITSGYIMLFSLQPKEKSERSTIDKQAWYTWLKETLKSVVKKQELMIGPITDTQVPVLFLCKKTIEKIHFRSYAQSIIEKINSLFNREPYHADLRVGVGLPYNHAHELNKSYHEAVLAFGNCQGLRIRSFYLA
ncbi:hypothetical protein NDK43_32940 [Neobacillus pocheonensis]|uniref:CdaR GGDEF-like domain-containing protein n=1 Tax=Neobacillus pocheonensis TaxID=363869 RepID=A0ABT0WIQ6_9BACI|nr:hypothetical protein [Neobacillus pocheonensis]